jgi:hypothetical protein
MTDTMELARRAVACKGWRWLPGMTAIGLDQRWTALPSHFWIARWPSHEIATTGDLSAHILPDLTDVCTLGGLLALVREAWGDPMLTPRWVEMDNGDDKCFIVRQRHDEFESRYSVAHGSSERAALVAALEAAP